MNKQETRKRGDGITRGQMITAFDQYGSINKVCEHFNITKGGYHYTMKKLGLELVKKIETKKKA